MIPPTPPPNRALAHSAPPDGSKEPQTLIEHLGGVVQRAQNRLEQIAASWPKVPEWFREAQRLVGPASAGHDIGKATLPFFGCLTGTGSWAPHAPYSVTALIRKLNDSNESVESYFHQLYLIWHHHTGFKTPWKEFCSSLYHTQQFLRNATTEDQSILFSWKKDLSKDTAKLTKPDHYDANGTLLMDPRLVKQAYAWLLKNPAQGVLKAVTGGSPIEQFLTLRIAMGALVHGDGVDTAGYYGSRLPNTALEPLQNVTAQTLAHKQKLEKTTSASADVLALRKAVFDACSTASDLTAWLYTLCAPTGGAKTLSSLAFAGLLRVKRIAYILPYLSIVDQTSELLSQLGISKDVLEHVSVRRNLKEEERDLFYQKQPGEIDARQDWLHSLIVSTTERLSRVLVGPSNSDARRMLSLIDSSTLVIIDEAHSIPPHKLYAYLKVLERLGCKVLLLTATAEAVKFMLEDHFPYVDLAPNLPDLRSLRNYTWEKHDHREGPDLSQEFQVLSIYNTRRWAHEAFEKLRSLPHACLITSMQCPQHRRRTLEDIRKNLRARDACVTVATQTVEAGTNFSFPKLYRMLATLASQIQAGGRCNREGEIEAGEVIIWRPKNFGLKIAGEKWDAPDDDYLDRANKLWAQVAAPGKRFPTNDHEMRELERVLAVQEAFDLKKMCKAVDKAFAQGKYGYGEKGEVCFGDLCVIPRDDRVSVVVDYEGAHRKLLQGRMYRHELNLFTVELNLDPKGGASVPVIAKNVLFCGEKKETLVYFYKGHYDNRSGIAP